MTLENQYGQYEGCMDNMKFGKPEFETAFTCYARKSRAGRKIIKIIVTSFKTNRRFNVYRKHKYYFNALNYFMTDAIII